MTSAAKTAIGTKWRKRIQNAGSSARSVSPARREPNVTAIIPATVNQKVMRPPAPRPSRSRSGDAVEPRVSQAPSSAPATPVTRIGSPARRRARDDPREHARRHRDHQLDARPQQRDEECEEGEGEDHVDAELLGVGDRRRRERPAERREVPGEEQAELGAEERAERALRRARRRRRTPRR